MQIGLVNSKMENLFIILGYFKKEQKKLPAHGEAVILCGERGDWFIWSVPYGETSKLPY